MQSQTKRRIGRIIVFLIALMAIIPIAAVSLFLATNSWGLTSSAILSQSFPEKDTSTPEYPESFLPIADNLHEVQGTNQCAGYSAAFLLRHYGYDNTLGADAYAQMDYKLSTGYVLPQAIVDYLTENGLQTRLVTSSLEQLKAHVSSGNPIIVLIGSGRHWQHYVTVIGYDSDNIYLVDTLKEPSTDPYNRTMTHSEFTTQWNNGIPFFGRAAFIASPA